MKQIQAILRQYGILLGFAAVIIALSILSPSFLTSRNLLNLVRQSSIHGIMAVGMTFVILSGGIDLSVGSLLAVTGLACAKLEHSGVPLPAVVAATLLLGAAVGAANGAVITLGKVTPFVVTLGSMSMLRGFAQIWTKGEPISGFGPAFRWIGSGEILRIPVPVILLLTVTALSAFVLRRTVMGRYTYAIGSNSVAARLAGVSVDPYQCAAYAICGTASALGALVLTSRLNAAETNAGTGYELDVIASVVIGGTSLMGGRGSVWRTLIGALLIGVINNGMNLLMISPHYQPVVKGAIIVAAVLVDRFRASDRS